MRRNSLDSNNNNGYANSSCASLDLNNSEVDFNWKYSWRLFLLPQKKFIKS